MTRRPSLTSLFYGFACDDAIEAVLTPKLFAVQIAQSYMHHGEALDGGCDPRRGFLAWVQMWLELLLGRETNNAPSAKSRAPYPVAVLSHRAANYVTGRKAPAHNLEALMRFAPDAAGGGLTLNQYRERFTRLSVMGRMQIYARVFARRFRHHRLALCRLTQSGALGKDQDVICGVPLWPD